MQLHVCVTPCMTAGLRQLACFMEDLEASGLLKDSATPAGEPAPPAEARPADGKDAAAGPDSTSDPDTSAAAAASSAVEGHADVQTGGQAGTVSEEDPGGLEGGDVGATATAAGADAAGAGEQRVLGLLEGAPGWHEARDCFHQDLELPPGFQGNLFCAVCGSLWRLCPVLRVRLQVSS